MRFKKITSLLLATLLAGGTLTVAAEETVETVQTTMTVDETSVIKPSDRRMLGINDGWWGSQAVKANSTDINPEFVETFKENGVKIPDTTHQREAGARWVASMIADLLRDSDCTLREYLVCESCIGVLLLNERRHT